MDRDYQRTIEMLQGAPRPRVDFPAVVSGVEDALQHRFAPDYSASADMMLNPAMAGLNEMDPAGAKERSSLQGRALKEMAMGAYPLLYNAGNALLHTLAPTPAGAGEPTFEQNNRLRQLDALIAEEIKKKNAALNAAKSKTTSRGTDKYGNPTRSTTDVPLDEATASRVSAGFDQNIANWQKERQSLLPWIQTAPAWERAIIEHAPEISFGFGTGAGLLTKSQLKAMGIGGLGSLGEGMFASTWPTVQDMHLPDNSPAGIEARKNWHSRDWWLNNVLPEIGEAAILGTIGGKTGNMVRQGAGQMAGGIKNLGRSATPAPTPSTPMGAPPISGASPMPWSPPKIAPLGRGIGNNGPYYTPNPNLQGMPESSLTQQEIAALMARAQRR